MKPKFQHDCTLCKFLGHFDGHDVYYCSGGTGDYVKRPDIVARISDEGHEYASWPVDQWQQLIERNGDVAYSDGRRVPFLDYIGKEPSAGRAVLIALALVATEHLSDSGSEEKQT